jgi:hypothetical protein
MFRALGTAHSPFWSTTLWMRELNLLKVETRRNNCWIDCKLLLAISPWGAPGGRPSNYCRLTLATPAPTEIFRFLSQSRRRWIMTIKSTSPKCPIDSIGRPIVDNRCRSWEPLRQLFLQFAQKPTANTPILQRRNKLASNIDPQITKIGLFREGKQASGFPASSSGSMDRARSISGSLRQATARIGERARAR